METYSLFSCVYIYIYKGYFFATVLECKNEMRLKYISHLIT